jgi:hypothetical protein
MVWDAGSEPKLTKVALHDSTDRWAVERARGLSRQEPGSRAGGGGQERNLAKVEVAGSKPVSGTSAPDWDGPEARPSDRRRRRLIGLVG